MDDSKIYTMLNIDYLKSGTYFSENLKKKSFSEIEQSQPDSSFNFHKKFTLSNAINELIHSKEYSINKPKKDKYD